MHKIIISNSDMERLKKWAEPFTDTPQTALSKVLDAAEGIVTDGKRSSGGISELPKEEYAQPLIELLYERGGSARVKDIRSSLFEKMRHRMNESDMETQSNGYPRYWIRITLARRVLLQKGFILSKSERGVWRLSEKGICHYEKSDAALTESARRTEKGK